MKCERCGEREGAIRYTEYTDGVPRKQLICATCAEELGFGPPEAGASESGASTPPGASVDPAVFGAAMLVSAVPDDTRCPGCGLRVTELQNVSLLGCARCYDVYEELLGPALERLHGASTHRGRLPSGSGGEGPASPKEGEA